MDATFPGEFPFETLLIKLSGSKLVRGGPCRKNTKIMNKANSTLPPIVITISQFSKLKEDICSRHTIEMRKTVKRPIGRCHPKTKKKHKCLPIKLPTDTSCKPTDEHCLLDKATLPDDEKRRLRKEYLRPRYPTEWNNDPDMWLSNYDIEAVMRQYEEADPTFKFMGTLPIDFSAPDPYNKHIKQCLHPEMCKLDLKAEYQRGIRHIAIVFNLDPHFKSGSHWIALFISIKNIRKPWAAYFDSYGYPTPKQIAIFMRSLKDQIPSIKLMYNARRFQYGGSECGMYSLYFIITMLSGMPFKQFCKHAVPDGEMLRLREVLFSR